MTPERLALKRATGEMIKGVGGLEAGSNYTRVGKSMLADYGSVHKPDCFVPIDIVADLEPLSRERSGWPHATRALCRMMGGTFVPEPELPVTGADLFAKLGTLHNEFADVTGAVCNGMRDGVWSSEDGAELERQLDDVIEIAIRMRALARLTKGDNA